MRTEYEIVFLSRLFKKSRFQIHPDFKASLDYIFARIDELSAASENSQFHRKIFWLKRMPRRLLVAVLKQLRYDAMMGFREKNGVREVYGMISFQKHPQQDMIGMFDIYLSPQNRNRDLLENFRLMADLVYELCEAFKKSHYLYIQCGYNDTTRKILRLYKRVARQRQWNIQVDVAQSRIYL